MSVRTGLYTYEEKNALQIVNGRRYHRDRMRYEVRYCNTEEILLRQYAEDMNTVYGVNPSISNEVVKTRSKRIFNRLNELGAGGSHEWHVADEVMEAEDAAKQAWLQAFFDDEGTVDKRSGRIRLKSVNKEGLKDAIRLMDEIGVQAHLTGPNCDDTWYLNVNKADVPSFFENIGFTHPMKKRRCAKSAAEVRNRP